MLCIIKFDDEAKDFDKSWIDGEPIARTEGWIIAENVFSAGKQAYESHQLDLAEALTRVDEFKPGKHFLSTGHMVLAS